MQSAYETTLRLQGNSHHDSLLCFNLTSTYQRHSGPEEQQHSQLRIYCVQGIASLPNTPDTDIRVVKVIHSSMLSVKIRVGFPSLSWLLCKVSGLIKLASVMVSLRTLFPQEGRPLSVFRVVERNYSYNL